MKVKCVDIDEKRERETAYKAENGRYYSSKEAYVQIKEENKRRKWATDTLIELLGFNGYKIIPSILFKVIASYKEIGYEALCKTITDQRRSIERAVKTKNFKNDFAKIRYVEAIINNNINNINNSLKKEKRQKDIIIEDVTLNNPKQKQKDISRFLEA